MYLLQAERRKIGTRIGKRRKETERRGRKRRRRNLRGGRWRNGRGWKGKKNKEFKKLKRKGLERKIKIKSLADKKGKTTIILKVT